METKPTVWEVSSEESDYPDNLKSYAIRWPRLYCIGNRKILESRTLGLICSVQCPGSIVINTFDAIRELGEAGVVVAGGFHSPMEQECLEYLLRGNKTVIICPAKGSDGRINPAWQDPIKEGRLLLASPFDSSAKRISKQLAQERNELVAALSKAVLIPHASPGGKVEELVIALANSGKQLFAFENHGNEQLRKLNVKMFAIKETFATISVPAGSISGEL